MVDVGANKYGSEDWASSQSSVLLVPSSGKQERSSSSSSTSASSVLLREHDYIGMNEVSSSFKASSLPKRSAAGGHLNLQETELRLGICCSGASFQPKPDAVNPEGASESAKVLDLGASKANLVEGGEKKLPEMANRCLNLAPEKDPGSPFAAASAAPVSKSSAKRVFSEAIGGEGSGFPSHLSKLSSDNPFTQLSKHPLLPPLYPWKIPKQQQQQFISKPTKVDDGEAGKVEPGDPVEDSSTRAPVVGWPPVQSFRKNTLAVPQPSKSSKAPESQKMAAPSSSSQINSDPASPFVKVYMDGVSIGRKVEIRTDDSYDKLVAMLEEMFQHHISGQNSKESLGENKKLNFLSSDSEFVLTYEDKDGDLMLVGDVPWKMFVGTVKRLRIMKGTDAIGLAPRGSSD